VNFRVRRQTTAPSMSEPNTESPTVVDDAANPAPPGVSRRQMLMTLGIALNAIAGALFAIPIIGYILSPAQRKQMSKDLSWLSLGPITQFPVGETRLAVFENPSVRPWDGDTGHIPCWVRRIADAQWQVFAINCAHLGCPVRWFPQSKLFMCPCHGGVYYADGARASGPPPRGLFEYSHKIEKDELWIKAGEMPTLGQPLGNQASATNGKGCSCA
jgi:menaquinol-cytochrome c reductase iron-sulfur subunit